MDAADYTARYVDLREIEFECVVNVNYGGQQEKEPARLSEMETQPHPKLARDVGRFVAAKLLQGRHVVDRERRGFIIYWRGADVPAHIVRLGRPVPGYRILR